MIIYDKLFKPRQLPEWWVRFTDSNRIIPAIIALTGLVWISLSMAHIVIASTKEGTGQVIETFKTVSGSGYLVDKAISLREAYHELFSPEIRSLFFNLYGNIALYLVVPFLLLLEFLFPCDPNQPLIGKGFLQDLIWYLIAAPLILLILFPVLAFFRGIFEQWLGFISLHSARSWPVYLQIIAAVLMAEFIIWSTHYIRHKVTALWYFHAIHHSQEELNIFTENRAHIVDLLVVSVLGFIPFFIFQVSDLYAVLVIGIYKPIHARFIHANVKMNLGWLGWIFTNPQFHRVHHSVQPEHRDKNFGAHLSIYDHLFGTAYRSREVYPLTGIEDMRFPTEKKLSLARLPANLISQTVYPFLQLVEKIPYVRRINGPGPAERWRDRRKNSKTVS